MNITIDEIFIRNGYINAKQFYNSCAIDMKHNRQLVGTILANMASYGYAPSVELLNTLTALAPHELQKFWETYEPVFKSVTGANRSMEKFVVYKNFPKEVLEMSAAEYWFNQICMYLGAPNQWFTEEVKERPAMLETLELKVLTPSDETTVDKLTQALIESPARWSDNQRIAAMVLYDHANFFIDVDQFSFKENGIDLVRHAISKYKSTSFDMSNATDVLRLCAALSEQDISLRTTVRFHKFPRPLRKKLLQLLNSCKNLKEDFSSRPELWKRLLERLHPGDYPQFTHVTEAYDALYNDSHLTFNKIVDGKVYGVQKLLETLQSRPGEFMRRFHAAYKQHGTKAVDAFCEIVPKLSNSQLVKFHKYLQTVNDRATFIVPPKGNWSRAKVLENNKAKIAKTDFMKVSKAIKMALNSRLNEMFPDGVDLDERLTAVKLQTNDQKLAEYGRGTTFDIPENIKFLRSASYWEQKSHGNVWFDNGWNFFDSNWNSVGVCAWNDNHRVNGAVFSGDPTNSKDLKGRGCQMIDLYLDQLAKSGVRFAVWNVLCYSKIPFSEATDVLATLQMGENPEKGKLYEPARAQMVFPLTGKALTKYVAFVDVKERKLVYMDADLGGNVQSASMNGKILEKIMPAYVEYLNSLPSVHDLFRYAKKGTTPILYSDENRDIREGTAYVFKQLNAENKYEKLSLANVL